MLSSLHCAPCHPDVGTGVVTSVCPSLCDKIMLACREEFFTVSNVQGLVQPCVESSLICSPLRVIASSGLDACKKLTNLNIAPSNSLDDEKCYDGSVPSKISAFKDRSYVPQEGESKYDEEDYSFLSVSFYEQVGGVLVLILLASYLIVSYQFQRRQRMDTSHDSDNEGDDGSDKAQVDRRVNSLTSDIDARRRAAMERLQKSYDQVGKNNNSNSS